MLFQLSFPTQGLATSKDDKLQVQAKAVPPSEFLTAINSAKEIANPVIKAKVLRELSEVGELSGRAHPELLDVAVAGLKKADPKLINYSEAMVARDIVSDLASHGKLKQAIELAKSIGEPQAKSRAFADLIDNVPPTDKTQIAAIKKEIADPLQMVVAEAKLTVRMAVSGINNNEQFESTRMALGKYSNQGEADSMRIELATLLAGKGQIDKSQILFKDIKDTESTFRHGDCLKIIQAASPPETAKKFIAEYGKEIVAKGGAPEDRDEKLRLLKEVALDLKLTQEADGISKLVSEQKRNSPIYLAEAALAQKDKAGVENALGKAGSKSDEALWFVTSNLKELKDLKVDVIPFIKEGIERAKTRAESKVNPEYAAMDLAGYAAGLKMFGQDSSAVFQEAIRVVQTTPNDYKRFYGMIQVANTLIGNGEKATPLISAMTKMLETQGNTSEFLAFAALQKKAGLSSSETLANALKVVDEMKDSFSKVQGYLSIASTMREMGLNSSSLMDKAFKVAAAEKDNVSLGYVARAYFEIGDKDKAFTIAKSISDPNIRVSEIIGFAGFDTTPRSDHSNFPGSELYPRI